MGGAHKQLEPTKHEQAAQQTPLTTNKATWNSIVRSHPHACTQVGPTCVIIIITPVFTCRIAYLMPGEHISCVHKTHIACSHHELSNQLKLLLACCCCLVQFTQQELESAAAAAANLLQFADQKMRRQTEKQPESSNCLAMLTLQESLCCVCLPTLTSCCCCCCCR